MPEAYETLLHDVVLHDVVLGEAGLFSSCVDEVEESWAIVAPIMDAWTKEKDIATYPAGTLDIP